METFFVYLVFLLYLCPRFRINYDGYYQTLYQATQCPNCYALPITLGGLLFV